MCSKHQTSNILRGGRGDRPRLRERGGGDLSRLLGGGKPVGGGGLKGLPEGRFDPKLEQSLRAELEVAQHAERIIGRGFEMDGR